LKETGAVGFRLDAIKHMDRRFLLEFLRRTRLQSSPDMFAVSEYWSGNIDLLRPYIKAFKGETSFFDVPLHQNFHEASEQGPKYDLRKILNRTVVKSYPNDAVTFVDNHDTVVGQSLESWVGPGFKVQAYALILLREHGYPCVFYGDIYPNDEGYSPEIARSVKVLSEARKLYAYGTTDDYFQGASCIGFVRRGDSAHSGCAVLLGHRLDQSSPQCCNRNDIKPSPPSVSRRQYTPFV
jgi:alpha-amylase